jgi:OOP family OmpA-OmpF porin
VTGIYSDGTSRELPDATLRASSGTVTGRSYVVPTEPGSYTVTADCGGGRTTTATVTVRAVAVTIRAMFGFDRAAVTSTTELDSLRILAEMLKQYPTLQLSIFGHTDWTGSVAYNERLGMRRIQAVLDTLVSYGVDRARVDSWTKISFGECQPLADNRTREGRAQNRRVTIYDSRSAAQREGGGRCQERP